LLAAGVHLLSIHYQSFAIINPFNRSTAIPEKISFWGRQKSGGKQPSSFLIFGRA
jgi:hypothetical protein